MSRERPSDVRLGEGDAVAAEQGRASACSRRRCQDRCGCGFRQDVLGPQLLARGASREVRRAGTKGQMSLDPDDIW